MPQLGLSRPELVDVLVDHSFQQHLRTMGNIALRYGVKTALGVYQDNDSRITIGEPLVPPVEMMEAAARGDDPDNIRGSIDIRPLVYLPDADTCRDDLGMLIHTHPDSTGVTTMGSLPSGKDIECFRKLRQTNPGLICGVLAVIQDNGFVPRGSLSLLLYRARILGELPAEPLAQFADPAWKGNRRGRLSLGRISYTSLVFHPRTLEPISGMDGLGSMQHVRQKFR